MDKKIKDAFFYLLKLGLWGSKNDSMQFPVLNNNEWSLIYEIAVSQTVEGLVYEGILSLPNMYYPPYEILLRWTAKIDSIERFNKKVRFTLSNLSEGLAKSNISFILLKGLGLAENYRNPLLRVSGDLDLYFTDINNYNKANSLLLTKGCIIKKGDHNSTFYTFNNVEVEHHTKMIDVYNPFLQKYIKKLIESELPKFKEIEINNRYILIPSYLISHVQANAHILKHYMGFGIGLRQICDVARLCYMKEESFDGNELKMVYSKLGLSKWTNVLHNILVKDLGLDPSKLPYAIESDYKTDSIICDILNSGNFGFHDIRFRETDVTRLKSNQKRDRIYQRVIPHIYKLMKLTPSEVFWFPLSKAYTKITGN